MYIAISAQRQGENFSGSVSDFVKYLEKENEEISPEHQEQFFNQYNDRISAEEVIEQIDKNTTKLNKKDPKFYSIVVSPSQRELKAINNDPEKLREYIREMMKDYAASFHRNNEVKIDDIKYFAKIERERTFKGNDKEIRENQPYATKILKLQGEIRDIESGKAKGNIKVLKKEIKRLEMDAPHKINGKRIVRGMKKEGMQNHVHIIVSHKDATNSNKLSPLAKNKEAETIINGQKVKQGFNRDKFFAAAEKTFDKKFNYKRNFVESYKARNVLDKNPKQFFAMLAGLPTTEKQAAFKMLFKSGVNVPTIPTNKVQLAYKALMKLKRGVETAINSGSIGV
ncbi:MobB family relaxase [Flagellimonas nanhaiensis]|uniref:Mobilization protein n=1 Tax=Flagellimonas nanhaiensis TaxID=2292706 RepID=A0A371JLF5_9FLAO|nr:MobB family relaxase [Allomuricauda nanhaiensis]RDY57842.1 mobilization protein [Allomuricauda nanhaiensis]